MKGIGSKFPTMKRFLPRSTFERNVLVLMTGTTIAQFIPIVISPLLTRIYTPEDFGLFALYMGFASIFSIFATGRYEQAIMLPKEDDDAVVLASLSFIITICVSFFLFLLVFTAGEIFSALFEKPEIQDWLYFLPLTVFLTGACQILNILNNRQRHYETLAKNRVYQSVSVSICCVGGGILSGDGFFLIICDLIGKVVSVYFLFSKKDFRFFSKKRYINLARRYWKFPIFDTGATLANVSSYQIQNILFSFFYGLSNSGFYFLVSRVLQVPLSIISTSLTDVYKQKLTDYRTTNNDLKKYYKKMFIFLFSIGLPPASIFMLTGEKIFIIVFGNEWGIAGRYAVILAPMFFIKFIASPLSYFLYLKEKQEIDIIGNMLFLLCGILSVTLSTTIEMAVICISGSFSLIYIGYILYSAKLSKIADGNLHEHYQDKIT